MYRHTFLGYNVYFTDLLQHDKAFVFEDRIHLPESMAYKFFFMDGVTNTSLKVVCDHAIQKLHRFIDNL